ncbi:MAG: hypothetical protein DWQ10_03375, partial [Calditrichaeota bacterium]
MRIQTKFLKTYVIILFLLHPLACDTGVELSQDPGILRVVLQADSTESSITIANKTYSVEEGDRYGIKVFQGKVYQDSTFYVLYKNPSTYVQEDQILNIIEADGEAYKSLILFESRVPAGTYDKVQFGLTATEVQLGNLIIPILLPDGESPLIDLHESFVI